MTSPAATAAARRAGAEAGSGRLFTVFLLSVILSACSILYELLVAQTLSLLAANTVVWYSLVVGTYLAAMGVGAALSRRAGARSPWRSLFRVEIALTAIGASAVPLIHVAHTAYSGFFVSGDPSPGRILFFATGAAIVVSVGMLTGIELPLLMQLGREIGGGTRAANTVLGLDYIGSLAGGILFPLVLLPSMTLFGVGYLTAAVNLAVAAGLVIARPAGPRGKMLPVAVTLIVALPLAWASLRIDPLQQYFLRRYYYYLELPNTWEGRFEPRPDLPRVLRAASPYQKIDLMQDIAPDYSSVIMPAYSTKLARHPDHPLDYILTLNGEFQTNTRYDEIYHEWFAHVPIILNMKAPRRVLLLGGGDGFLLRELLKYETIRSITHVDIDHVLVDLARNHEILRTANRDSFRDPRVETIYGDAFQYVRRSNEPFDAVYMDFPVPTTYDLAKLYSSEFFDFVRRRIAPGGFAVFDATGTSLVTEWTDEGRRWLAPDNDWPIYYNTLRKAGFRTIVPYLTTLERDNLNAAHVLAGADFGPEFEQQFAGIADPIERQRRRAETIATMVQQLLDMHVVSLEQGMIMMTPEKRDFTIRFTHPGVELDVLDERRFELSFEVPFPMPDGIDPSKVNSIMRPTFPTVPWWRPRLPF